MRLQLETLHLIAFRTLRFSYYRLDVIRRISGPGIINQLQSGNEAGILRSCITYEIPCKHPDNRQSPICCY